MSGTIRQRATRNGVEKHRAELESYRVDFASGASPRLSSTETLTTGSVTVIRVRGSAQVDVTAEFNSGTTGSITGTVATGAQASSAVEFSLQAASASGHQDADEEYFLRVDASTSTRNMVSIHKLTVWELGDTSAP